MESKNIVLKCESPTPYIHHTCTAVTTNKTYFDYTKRMDQNVFFLKDQNEIYINSKHYSSSTRCIRDNSWEVTTRFLSERITINQHPYKQEGVDTIHET